MVEQVSVDKLVGTALGKYRLEECVEKGGLGPVFLARADGGGTTYRLRVVTVGTGLTAEARIVYLGRFQQLANEVAELHNPYILPLLDYGNHLGMPYLVWPNLSALSLSTVLKQNGPLDVLMASRYLDQMATALEYAYEHAVLHRNLTTSCVFVKSDENLVVADFGVMRMLELGEQEGQDGQGKGQAQAQDGQPQGVPLHYGSSPFSAPAPEQIRGEQADTYTDVYALGALLYRMLTGHRVFQSANRDELMRQHLQAAVPSVSKWRGGLPAEIDGIIAKAMAKEPGVRFRSAGELANAYHEVVAPDDGVRKPFGVTPPGGEKLQVGMGAIHRAPTKHGGAAPGLWRNAGAIHRVSTGQTRMSRRRALRLIGTAGGAAVGITAAAVFASRYFVGTSSPTSSTGAVNGAPTGGAAQGSNPPIQGGNVLARAVDVPLNSAKSFPIANSQNPGLLVHLSDNRFVAFDSTCTHTGCPVSYNSGSKLLECPCHGAVFDPARSAAVVAGPAPSPLREIHVSLQGDGTIIQQ